MPTNYPSSIDSFTNPSATDYLNTAAVLHHLQHTNGNDAITAIENALGSSPAGTASTVAVRLTNIDGSITSLNSRTTTISSNLNSVSSNLTSLSSTVTILQNRFPQSGIIINANTAGSTAIFTSTYTATADTNGDYSLQVRCYRGTTNIICGVIKSSTSAIFTPASTGSSVEWTATVFSQ